MVPLLTRIPGGTRVKLKLMRAAVLVDIRAEVSKRYSLASR